MTGTCAAMLFKAQDDVLETRRCFQKRYGRLGMELSSDVDFRMPCIVMNRIL
jgi:hypothetical protein